MKRSQAAAALDALCRGRRGAASELAAAIGVSAPTVHNYQRGAMRPGADRRAQIETWSGGAVRVDDWEKPEEHITGVHHVPAVALEERPSRTGTEG